ncbi:MAG: nitrite reductase small subunit NirD [Oceanococcus sp.]
MNWTSICKLEDIVCNTGVGALINGHQVAVFRLSDDSVFAIDNFDPHSQANVLSRGIVGDIAGHVVVASPIYKQHFRLDTGICLQDANKSIAAHKIRVVDGLIEVQLNEQFEQAA